MIFFSILFVEFCVNRNYHRSRSMRNSKKDTGHFFSFIFREMISQNNYALPKPKEDEVGVPFRHPLSSLQQNVLTLLMHLMRVDKKEKALFILLSLTMRSRHQQNLSNPPTKEEIDDLDLRVLEDQNSLICLRNASHILSSKKYVLFSY